MRAVAGTLVLFALLGFVGRARADAPAAPALSWSRAAGAESCVAGPELAKAVEAQLGREILVALPQAQLNVEGTVALAEHGYHVHLRLSDPNGSTLGDRTLVAATNDCRALDPLLIFLIALMLDPDAPLLPPRLPAGLSAATLDTLSDLFGAEPTVPPLELARATPSATSPRRAPGDESVAPARRPVIRDDEGEAAAADNPDDGWRLGVQLDGLAAVGVLPAPAGGVRLSLAAAPSRALAFYLGAAFFPENAIEAGGAGFSLAQAELAACPRLAALASAWSLRACIRFAAGALLARAEGESARDPARLAMQAGVGPELVWAFGVATAMHLGLGVAAPLIRDRFFMSGPDGRNQVFRMSQIVGQASLAFGVDFL